MDKVKQIKRLLTKRKIEAPTGFYENMPEVDLDITLKILKEIDKGG